MAEKKALSVLDPTSCNIYSMVHKEHHKDYQVWYDPFLRKEYSEYKLYGEPNDKQTEIYQFRKQQTDNLIYVHYFSPFNDAGFKQFRIFVERIPLTLSTLQRLSFIQGICIIKGALRGFQTIFERFGYVHIDDKLIGINSEGSVKVWMNENFAYNGVAQTHTAPKWMSEQLKVKQMISTIFSLVQDRLDKNNRLTQFKKQKQLKLISLTFEDTLEFLNRYAKLHRIIIPSSVPELLRWNSSTNSKKQLMTTQAKIKQPLSFKKSTRSPKRRLPSKKNYFSIPLIKDTNKIINPQSSRTFGNAIRLLSPAPSVEANLGIRPRNVSEITMSVAESKAKTSVNPVKTRMTKYFNQKSMRNRVQSIQKDHITLQSSLISKDLSSAGNFQFIFAQGKKNNLEQFKFSQIQNQKPKTNNKKRKYSAVDQMTFQANNLKSKANQNASLSLARSLLVKNKLEGSGVLLPNPEIEIPDDETPSKISNNTLRLPNHQRYRAVSPNSPLSPNYSSPPIGFPLSPVMRERSQTSQSSYSIEKPFLNYKAIKNSIINHEYVGTKVLAPPPSLRTQLLNNMDMKCSQIIIQKSEQYASLRDMMKPIKESQAETPRSESNNDNDFQSSEKNVNLFITSAEKRRGSDTNISNSTSDHRSSSFHSEKKEGLMNFTSPKNTVKSGMFKSIFIGELKEEIKEVPEGDIQ